MHRSFTAQEISLWTLWTMCAAPKIKTKPTQVLRRVGGTLRQSKLLAGPQCMSEVPVLPPHDCPALTIRYKRPQPHTHKHTPWVSSWICLGGRSSALVSPIFAASIPTQLVPSASPASLPAGWARHPTLTRGHSESGPAGVAPPGTRSSRRR